MKTSADFLNAEHTAEILEALIDKYTMRSKAHRRLTNAFIEVVIESSLKQLQAAEDFSELQQMTPACLFDTYLNKCFFDN